MDWLGQNLTVVQIYIGMCISIIYVYVCVDIYMCVCMHNKCMCTYLKSQKNSAK